MITTVRGGARRAVASEAAVWHIQPPRWSAVVRVVTRVSLVCLVAFVALVPLAILSVWARGQLAQVVDYTSITGASSRWLATGQFYQPWQIAGPYAIHLGSAVDILYPPVVLWLAVPFVFLPPILWWVIPMAATLWAVVPGCVQRRGHGPSLFMLWAQAREVWLVGNVGMWIVAAEALGLLYGWPAVLVLVKPDARPICALRCAPAFVVAGARRSAAAVCAICGHVARLVARGHCEPDQRRAALLARPGAGDADPNRGVGGINVRACDD